MNHGWPNVGHHALVDSVRALASKLSAEIESPPLTLRVLSFDVRQGLAVPGFEPERFRL